MTNGHKIKVHALFDDGSADEIIFSYFGAPLSQENPIRAYSNDIQDLDIQRSAIDGASEALKNYEKYYKSSGERFCFAYKFSNDLTNQTTTGKSAGLAFSIKFALKLYKNQIKIESDFSIAATGIIEIDEGATQVKPVEKINKKLEAVLTCLQVGDFFFYPAANDHEIDPHLKTKIVEKGISLHSVENVDQVFKILFKIDEQDGGTLKWMLAALLICTVMILAVYMLFFKTDMSCYDKAVQKLEHGEFIEAKKTSDECRHETENDRIRVLAAKIDDELNLSADFIYIKSNTPENNAAETNSPLLLDTNDGYRFEIQTSQDCFLYIFQINSETETERLFPLSAYILNQHHLPKNRLIKIPGGENMFYLDNKIHHGTMTIFIVASFWRLRNLENIYNEYEDSQSAPIKRKLHDALINSFKSYSALKNKGIHCIFYKELSFIQE